MRFLSYFCIMFIAISAVLTVSSLVIVQDVFAYEDVYKKLSRITKSQQDVHQIKKLNQAGRKIDWTKAKELECHGHLRVLKTDIIKGNDDETKLFFIRNITGEIYILSIPEKNEILKHDLKTAYEELEKMLDIK